MSAPLQFFATTAKGLEDLLSTELRDCGASAIVTQRAGVAFTGPLEVAYRACLWSRVASRVLLPLARFRAADAAALYDGVYSVRWSDHIGRQRTLAVDCSTSQSTIAHSHFAALKTKDAIVDQLRAKTGARPSVDPKQPDVRINVYIHADRAVVSLDLSGDSLHRRGYRLSGTTAPLKENLAAAILLFADWPRLASERAPLLDPMCGSGTLLIEAALMAADIPPTRHRGTFGLLRWKGHDASLWTRLGEEAAAREIRDPAKLPIIRGYDINANAVRTAIGNIANADLTGRVHVERRELADSEPITVAKVGKIRGLLVTNPPYGERLGNAETLPSLYASLGDTLRRKFMGWHAYVLAGNPDLARHIGLRPSRRIVVYNGAIECRLLALPISATPVTKADGPGWRRERGPVVSELPTRPSPPIDRDQRHQHPTPHERRERSRLSIAPRGGRR